MSGTHSLCRKSKLQTTDAPAGLHGRTPPGHPFCYKEKMKLTIAAIRSGTEPVGKLPEGAFHRWLDDPINCPKCAVSYNLVAPWDEAVNKFFPDTSRPLIMMLRKAIFLGHANNHRVSHFETSGVIVRNVIATDTVKPRQQ